MRSTMQDGPLLISGILRHGQQVYGDSQVITCRAGRVPRRRPSPRWPARAERLAKALRRLGVGDGRPGRAPSAGTTRSTSRPTWPCPSMGAVLHTLNIRLFPEQLAYVINHAEDQVIIVDASLIPLLARVRDELTTVEHDHRGAARATRACSATTLDYDELARRRGARLRLARPRRAAGRGHVLHVSGTTGNPKGVVYSPPLHLPALDGLDACRTASAISERDRVPAHRARCSTPTPGACPYTALLAGRRPDHAPAATSRALRWSRIINEHRPTLVARRARRSGTTCSHASSTEPSTCRACAACSPPAAPRCPARSSRRSETRFGVADDPGLGHDRDEPAGRAWPIPPAGTPRRRGDRLPGQDRADRRRRRDPRRATRTGNGAAPTTASRWASSRSAARGSPASYYAADRPRASSTTAGCAPATSARSTHEGFMTISDRTKDVIKSGGEWISSVELENEVMAHPDVVEAAVIASPTSGGRSGPLVCVVAKPRATAPTPGELRRVPRRRVAKWWLPDQWTFIDGDPDDLGGQVRQEGPARPVRQGRARRRDARPPPRLVSAREELDELARDVDALAERAADRALDLLRAAMSTGPKGPEATAERLVTRARRSLEKAATLLRSVDVERLAQAPPSSRRPVGRAARAAASRRRRRSSTAPRTHQVPASGIGATCVNGERSEDERRAGRGTARAPRPSRTTRPHPTRTARRGATRPTARTAAEASTRVAGSATAPASTPLAIEPGRVVRDQAPDAQARAPRRACRPSPRRARSPRSRRAPRRESPLVATSSSARPCSSSVCSRSDRARPPTRPSRRPRRSPSWS